MKYIRLYFVLLMFGLLAGCFEDEGNYDYVEINPPTWEQEFNDRTPKNIYGYAGKGEVMKFTGSSMFRWEGDSVARAEEVRYEWKIGDVVISEELDFEIPTDELVEKIDLKRYSDSQGEWGTFNIIEKKTGIVFPARLYVWIYPTFAPDDWFLLSENGKNAKLSVVRLRVVEEKGQKVIKYEFRDDAYKDINGHEIPGSPLDLVMETSRDVSASGACVILTDQVAYEVNMQNLEKVSEVKDQFLDGTPADFNIIAMKEKAPQSPSFGEGSASFVATKDGRLFTRMRSANYLTGKYLTEPYYIDAKGYKITKIGHTRYGGLIPCYDEKNRRVVMATTWREDISYGEHEWTSVYKTRVLPINRDYGAPAVSGFPEGTEVLFLTAKNHISWGYGGTTQLFTIYYNDPTSSKPQTLVDDFSFDNRNGVLTYMGMERWFYLPVKLDASSVILVSASNRDISETANAAKYRDFYTVGDKLYYVQRGTDWSDKTVRFLEFNASFPSKITALAYAFASLDQLWVGCEDGSMFAYDIRNINSPKLVFEKNLGGKVVSMKQIGWHTSNEDWY
ncbi:PKD-like family lipoprotein [Butyricimonas sp. Marseille-P3923]|uniref:PKD-like family lipoprotein n=1 Tax=Butyricimonas sp. Marseille-P3923 TaxID=1987504 RepID=UPI00159B8C10|nr:PKD-like family lipoprotein [Butyricimonas sp. Marseille-P3923]